MRRDRRGVGLVEPAEPAQQREGLVGTVRVQVSRRLVRKYQVGGQRQRAPARVPPPWPLLLLATLLGTCAGLVLQQTALVQLKGGMAVALLSTGPVMALPLAPLEGDRPGALGLAAALLAVLGVALVAI